MARPIVPAVSRRRCSALLLLVLVPLWLVVPTPGNAASRPPQRGEHGMVVSADVHASRAGLAVLQAGGTAVDAAIATAFVLTVTYPLAAPVGGGGLLLLRTPGGEHRALDFRETAPRRLEAKMFLDEEGRPVPGRSLASGLAIGVPATVAGLEEAHRRWGRLPWADLVQPAIGLAQRGFPVSAWHARRIEADADKLRRNPDARRIFTRDGQPLREGDTLLQRDLARTLHRVAADGSRALRSGPVADAIVRAARRQGGVIEADDLADYRPVLREPLRGRYRGMHIVTFPPPSSGGVALLQMLGMLESFDLSEAGAGSSRTLHTMAEVERRAFSDRSRWLGDPDFFEVPVAGLLASDYLAERASTILPDRASPSASVPPGSPLPDGAGETLHLSTADSSGSAVALTMTLNGAFGTGIVAPGTGILLNNQMDDFALAPGIPNQWGLLGAEANAVAGGKRPLSSMTPTIVEPAGASNRPLLVLGSPGGSTIITSVLQVVVNVVDHGLPLQEAVDAARFHHQWYPDRIRVEPWALSEDVRLALEARGHEFEERGFLGNVNAVATDTEGRWVGAADPRRHGTAAGY